MCFYIAIIIELVECSDYKRCPYFGESTLISGSMQQSLCNVSLYQVLNIVINSFRVISKDVSKPVVSAYMRSLLFKYMTRHMLLICCLAALSLKSKAVCS